MSESHRPDMPLSDLWKTYVEQNPRVRSKHTVSLMTISVRTFQDFLGRPGALADFTNENLVAYMEYRKQLGRAPRTIEREVSKLATIWRFAATRGPGHDAQGWRPSIRQRTAHQPQDG